MHFASFAHPRGLLEDIGLLPPSSAPLQDDDVADSVSPRDSSGRRRAQAHVRTNAHSHAHTHAHTPPPMWRIDLRTHRAGSVLRALCADEGVQLECAGMLREVEPGLTRAHTDLYLQADPALTCAQPPSVASTLPTASRPSHSSFHERGGGFGSLSIQGSAVLGQEGREEVGGAGVRDDDDSFFMA